MYPSEWSIIKTPYCVSVSQLIGEVLSARANGKHATVAAGGVDLGVVELHHGEAAYDVRRAGHVAGDAARG